MSRYFTAPAASIWTAPSDGEWRAEQPTSVTVYSGEARDTGLLSADGKRLFADDRQHVGYLARPR